MSSTGQGQDMWLHVSALKPVLRTKYGKLLQMLEDGRWQEVNGGMNTPKEPVAVGHVLPAIANLCLPTGMQLARLACETGVLV